MCLCHIHEVISRSQAYRNDYPSNSRLVSTVEGDDHLWDWKLFEQDQAGPHTWSYTWWLCLKHTLWWSICCNVQETAEGERSGQALVIHHSWTCLHTVTSSKPHTRGRTAGQGREGWAGPRVFGWLMGMHRDLKIGWGLWNSTGTEDHRNPKAAGHLHSPTPPPPAVPLPKASWYFVTVKGIKVLASVLGGTVCVYVWVCECVYMCVFVYSWPQKPMASENQRSVASVPLACSDKQHWRIHMTFRKCMVTRHDHKTLTHNILKLTKSLGLSFCSALFFMTISKISSGGH